MAGLLNYPIGIQKLEYTDISDMSIINDGMPLAGQSHIRPPIMDVKKRLPMIVMSTVIASALVAIIAVITGSWGLLHTQLIWTILLSLGFCLVTWYDTTVSHKQSPNFGIVSFFVTIGLLAIGFYFIWLGPTFLYQGYDYIGYSRTDVSAVWAAVMTWLMICFIARFALLHVHLLLAMREKFNAEAITRVMHATVIILTAVALLLIIPVVSAWHGSEITSEIYWRAFGVLVVLDVLGTALIPITYALFFKKDEPVPPIGVAPSYTVPAGYGHPQATAVFGPDGQPLNPAGYYPTPVPNTKQPYYMEQQAYPSEQQPQQQASAYYEAYRAQYGHYPSEQQPQQQASAYYEAYRAQHGHYPSEQQPAQGYTQPVAPNLPPPQGVPVDQVTHPVQQVPVAPVQPANPYVVANPVVETETTQEVKPESPVNENQTKP